MLHWPNVFNFSYKMCLTTSTYRAFRKHPVKDRTMNQRGMTRALSSKTPPGTTQRQPLILAVRQSSQVSLGPQVQQWPQKPVMLGDQAASFRMLCRDNRAQLRLIVSFARTLTCWKVIVESSFSTTPLYYDLSQNGHFLKKMIFTTVLFKRWKRL